MNSNEGRNVFLYCVLKEYRVKIFQRMIEN